MSFAVLAEGIAHLYIMSVTGDRRAMWVEMKDIRDTIAIFKNFIQLSKVYPEYGTYDVQKKEFYGKYHPVIKMKYWAEAYFVGFAATSGFSLYYASVPDYINFFLGGVGLGINLLWFRAIHFLVFIYFLFSLSGHIYLSLIPVNWELLKSMVTGKEQVEIHR